MAVGMILACLAFAFMAVVEIKINVSSINLKLLVYSSDFLRSSTVPILEDAQ